MSDAERIYHFVATIAVGVITGAALLIAVSLMRIASALEALAKMN